MRRRHLPLSVCGLLLGLTLPLVPAPPAEATPAAGDALVLDQVDDDANGVATALQSLYDGNGGSAPVTGPSTTAPGGVKLDRPSGAASGTGIEILPADGSQLTVGTVAADGQWTSGARPNPVVRLLRPWGACNELYPRIVGTANTWGSLTVQDVSYDANGVVTRLTASFKIPCYPGSPLVTGTVRYASDVPYPAVASSATWLGKVAAGSITPMSVTLTNKGTAPATLAVPTASPASQQPGAPTLAVEGDTCSTTPLAPGASCSLDLKYVAGSTLVAGIRFATADQPRGFVSVAARAQEVVYPPNPPAPIAGDEAYDGVRIRWFNNNSAPDGYRVRRIDGPSPVLLADLVGVSKLEWVDTTLAKGETATYQVAAYNIAGEVLSDPITLTRPDLPQPPAPAARSVLSVEDTGGGTTADTTAGDTVTVMRLFPTTMRVDGKVGNRTVELQELSRLPGPGTFPVGTGPGEVHLGVWSPSYSCGSVTGSVVVREAWIKADLTPYRVDADFHLMCATTIPIEAQLRIGVDTPVAALTTTPASSLTDFAATVGETPDTRTVTLSNPGGVAVPLGTRTFTGADAGSFSVASDDCPASLDPGASCTVAVAFAPQRSLLHHASLTFSTGTPIGTRTLELAGSAIGPPPAETPILQGVLGRVLVKWWGSSDGGSPITSYRVERATGAGAFSAVTGDLPPTTREWIDTAAVPGQTYRYLLVATNQYGAEPIVSTQISTVTVPREELIASVLRDYQPDADLESLGTADGYGVPLGTGQDTDYPAVSPNGKWLAYTVYDGTGDAGLWLRSLTGSAAPRLLVDAPGVDEIEPAWSPDSTKVLFTSGTTLRTISLTPGATPVSYPGGASAASGSWLPDGSAVVAVDLTYTGGRLVRISSSGTRTTIAGTAGADLATVSPRGNRIAYVTHNSSGADALWLVPLGGGTSVAVASVVFNFFDKPTWAPDGKAVFLDQFGPYGSWEQVLWHDTGTSTGTAETVRAAAGYSVFGNTWRRQDLAAPTITFAGSTSRTTAAAHVPVQVVDDTVPVGGLTVSCTVDGKAVGRCTAGWSGTLAAGSHTLTVSATDPFGHHAVTSRTWVVDTVAPTISPAALPGVVLGGSATFHYTGSDAGGVASYDVRYRRGAWLDGSFGSLTVPTGWSRTTTLSKVLSLSPGVEACFSARARDVAGNVSAWSSERCTSAPLDERSLSRSSGWTAVSSSSAYRGTELRATSAGRTLLLPGAPMRRAFLVATTCPTCGSVEVWYDAQVVATISLRSSTTQYRRVFALPVLPKATWSTDVRVRSTSTRPVLIDGLGVRRT